jgi:hypothetical protein
LRDSAAVDICFAVSIAIARLLENKVVMVILLIAGNRILHQAK